MASTALRPTASSAALQGLPDALRAKVADRWSMYLQMAARSHERPPHHPEFLMTLFRVWASSDFVANNVVGHPSLLRELLDSGDLLSEYARDELKTKVEEGLARAKDQRELAKILRELRRKEMVRIAWRDLAGWASLEEVLRDLSELADTCVQSALALLHQWQCKEFGTPKKENGSEQSMLVLAMGKLGARELNFSSDIDLIFAYPEEGEGRRRNGISHEEFFTRLGQNLIHVLGDTDENGFVFRVDMRLRPYGDSGPLVMSFAALEEYYQFQGREWERYAMIKARPVTGGVGDREQLMTMLRPFVYRRYLDFGAIEALRELKQRIVDEMQRKKLEGNIKLGSGGIREIEFIVQSFQLIRGGREALLRERVLLKVLSALAQLRYLPEQAAQQLADAYLFLRKVENHLQAYADRQTHRLPCDDEGRERIAFSMGYQGWPLFREALRAHQKVVLEQFAQVFHEQQYGDGSPRSAGQDLKAVWSGILPEQDVHRILSVFDFDDVERAAELLVQLRDGYASRSLSSRGRERLDRLMPLLLAAIAKEKSSTGVLIRVIRLLEAIAGRSAYVSLLAEHPLVLSQLVQLCAASEWISELLAQHPILMDNLMDPRTLYQPVDSEWFRAQLAERMASVSDADLEQKMDILRQEKQSAVLMTATAEIAKVINTQQACYQLTEIAEAVLVQVLGLAWAYLVERHGVPMCGSRTSKRPAQFGIVGYGKLGGRELGYGSDLDLVFLYESSGTVQKTDGKNAVDNAVFFARLGQRIIHLINTQTPAGILYEIDMRLRPSGASGLLVSNLESFLSYQRTEAWTWEHQALVRARVVAGDESVGEAFALLRAEILARKRHSNALRTEIREMRERMRLELSADKSGYFDIKQGHGGVADIEFMVQYGVLLWSFESASLVEFTDNTGLLQAFASLGIMSADDVRVLSEAYQEYLSCIHALALAGKSHVIPEQECTVSRFDVVGIWNKVMDET